MLCGGRRREAYASIRAIATMGSCYKARSAYAINWLQVLGTTETPHIDQGVRHQFHPIVALLDVLETE
jgi:hypothetical protein